jgi:hypothetical protein
MAAPEHIEKTVLIIKRGIISAPLTDTFFSFKHLPAQVGLCLS